MSRYNNGNIWVENDTVYNRGLGGEILSASRALATAPPRLGTAEYGFGNEFKGKALDNEKGESYFAYNGHGDTTNLTKQSSGTALAITATYDYDAFGNCTATGGEADANPFRYNGQYTDSETGLIYLRNRYYDPTIGRFTQEDPAKDGLNWYVYCNNDPVNFVDPWGLTMTITGEGGDVRCIFDNIQSLTDDELVLKELDFEIGGQTAYGIYILNEYSGNKSVGTELVKRIIKNEAYDCKLRFADYVGDNAITSADPYYNSGYANMWYDENNVPHSNEGCGAQIDLGYDTVYVWTDDGNDDEVLAYMPLNIEIGHELIHALRMMGGNFKDEGYYIDRSYGVPYEEYEVSGLSYYDSNDNFVDCSSWRITENALRREQHMFRRTRY